MPPKTLPTRPYPGGEFHYRPDTSDLNTFVEVFERRCYRKVKISFDVEDGETWLDLGANVGAFAVYCLGRGAAAECYEPDPENFRLLRMNYRGGKTIRAAVTAGRCRSVTLHRSRKGGNFSRSSSLGGRWAGDHPVDVPNVWAGSLAGRTFDGVKMDVEGSEFGILDEGLVPRCDKLVLEYHMSRDRSAANLARRLGVLKGLFEVVSYPPELDRLAASGGDAKTFFDRLVFCKGWKKKPRGVSPGS